MASWFPWGSSSSNQSPKNTWTDNRSLPPPAENARHALLDQFTNSYNVAIACLLAGSATLLGRRIYTRYFRRIPNAGWVTPDMLARQRWVRGYVTRVGDADNFRLYHTPGIGWRWPLKFRRIPMSPDLKDQTIHIRMAGVDAPEAGHFGRDPQPFAEESLRWLKSKIENKFVYCHLIRRDQYARIVAMPHLKPRLLPGWLVTGKCLSLEMVRTGWGAVYEQAGAEYGPGGVAEFRRVQQEAQKAKRGMWKYGTQIETPAEYKRRYRDLEADVVPPSKPTAKTDLGRKTAAVRR